MLARKWMRFRSATLMILIALIACGLGGYRWYQDAVDRAAEAQVGLAASYVHAQRPDLDLAAFDAYLSEPSADGATQRVLFKSRFGSENLAVTIPLRGSKPPTLTSSQRPRRSQPISTTVLDPASPAP